MNTSSEIFPTGSNFSDYLFYNNSLLEVRFAMTSLVDIILILFDLPINFYVMWLIVTGTGNGIAAEFFSLNLAVSEIFICVESLLNHLTYKVTILWIFVGFFDGLVTTGRPLFQCLMCVERYLAVVHPVTFLKYKPLRYRVICSVGVWMASLSASVIIIFFNMSQIMLYCVFLFAQFFLFFSIQFFCLVAVLRALKQSGPGERGREINHMKRRAFNIILITNVTMFILYAPYLIAVALLNSTTDSDVLSTVIFVCFSLPGLVQPLLFLYRVRKLPFIKYQ